MNSFTHMIDSLLRLLIALGNMIVGGIVTIEVWLRGQLALFGLSRNLQTAILILVAALLIVASLRIFGGLIRVALVLVLILIGIHILSPIIWH